MTYRLRRTVAVFVISTLILFAACSDATDNSNTETDSKGGSAAGAETVLVPTSGTILFGRLDGTTERYLTISTDGANEQEIFEAEGCAPCAFLSPDGTRVMKPTVTADDRLTTALIAADGGEETILELPDESLNLGPGAWSADGERVALAGWDERHPARAGMYTAGIDGSDLTQVTESDGPFHEPIAWSPDGERILFFVDTGPVGPVTHAGDLFVVSVDGTGLQQINPPGVAFGRTFAGLAAGWSPDGRRVTFGGLDLEAGDGTGAVFVVDLDGGDPVQLSESGQSFSSVGWSPTGEWIAYSGFGTAAVKLAAPDGGEVVTLDGSEDSCCPVWSPDGTQLLVQRGEEGARGLWILDVNGEVVGQVTQTPGDYFGYGWGAAG